MQKENEQVIAEFVVKAKSSFMKKIKKKEAKEKKAEDKEAERILTQI
jgi:hypothetical protein